MSSEPRRVRRAFLIAPLVSAPALALTGALVEVLQEPGTVQDALAGAAHITPFFALFGVPLAYALAFGAGLPSYLLLKRHDQLRVGPILAVSGLLGGIGVAGAFVILLGGPFDWGYFGIGLPVGLAVGTTFWALAVRQRPADRRVA